MIIIGTDDGNIQLTKDGGNTWTKLNAEKNSDSKSLKKNLEQKKLFTNFLNVSQVIASQYKESRLFVVLNGSKFDNFLPYFLLLSFFFHLSPK